METDYIKNYHCQLEIRKYIFYLLTVLIVLGFPTWHYVDAYHEAVSFRSALHPELYNKRMDEALKVASIMMFILAIIVLPFFIPINRRFNTYHVVINQLNPAEIQMLKAINDSLLPFGKYFPAFIITSQYLHIFGRAHKVVPFKLITAHSVISYPIKNGLRYSIEIKTSDGKYYGFNISNNPVQLQQLNLAFAT